MYDPRLIQFIKNALAGGYTESQVEEMLVLKGWDKVMVSRAILDVKFGTENNPSEEEQSQPRKKKDFKKILGNKIFIGAATAIILLIILTITLRSCSSRSGRDIDLWCKPGTGWSDSSVTSEEPLVVRGFVSDGKDKFCVASSDSHPEIEFQFTENNKDIWKYNYQPAEGSAESSGRTKIR